MISNYPCGMSRADLIRAGEIRDPAAMPDWFGEMIDDSKYDPEELWDEFNSTDRDVSERYWLAVNYPDALWDAA